MNRVWAMPSRHTFTIPPIAVLLRRYAGPGDSWKGWIDPFAGLHSKAEFQNDIDPAVPCDSHQDALHFMQAQYDVQFRGFLLDPPYSITQAKDNYNGYGMDKLDIKPTSMAYWAEIKNEAARTLAWGGLAVCFGWSSMGLGKNRGFEMVELLLVAHGGSKNDTIVTVEVKVRERE